MDFEWDADKAATNLSKHGVSFEVVLKFDWERAVTRPDGRYDYGEPRWRALHIGEQERYVVVFTRRNEAYRIISVRKAHGKEVRKWAK